MKEGSAALCAAFAADDGPLILMRKQSFNSAVGVIC